MFRHIRRRSSFKSNLRRFCTTVRRHIVDEGDWFYSPEWWDTEFQGQNVFRSTSDKGNGIVSVLAYPSSRPSREQWPQTERWLNQTFAESHPDSKRSEKFMILGYQWRSLRFNEDTRQSAVKVMAACKESDVGHVIYMQQAHCLPIPYVKSMISAGLTATLASNFDLKSAVLGKKTMNILCIGHGGGSMPLFLASAIQGAVIDIVEIDPVVISASIQAMGFPAFSLMTKTGTRARPKPHPIDEMLWKGVHNRLRLHEADAEHFIQNKTTTTYDAVFIDAYDGDDIFPNKLWDPHSPFMSSLANRLDPDHGMVVVNLHSDSDDDSGVLPMGKYVSSVCKSYKDVVIGDGRGLGFTVASPWLCNSSLVVCRGFEENGDGLAVNTLMAKSLEVESLLNLSFSCLQYLKNGFVLLG